MMTDAQKCRVCCQPLDDVNNLYHQRCSKYLFVQTTAPGLPYAYRELWDLAEDFARNRVALAGARAKLSLHLERVPRMGSRLTIAGLQGRFILKLPNTIKPHLPETEHTTMRLAGLFGIDTVPHGLIALKSGETAYITRRIDRLADGGKVHMEDMCQLSRRLTEDKYRGSMEQIGRIINRFSCNPLFDCIRFLEVALFSFLTGNADMHLKNFSLIYPLGGMVQLSAAYDMIATRLLITEKVDPEEMALTLNGKKRNLTRDDFLALAARLGLNQRQTGNVLSRFSAAIPAMGPMIDRGFLPPQQKTTFKELVSERAGRLGLT